MLMGIICFKIVCCWYKLVLRVSRLPGRQLWLCLIDFCGWLNLKMLSGSVREFEDSLVSTLRTQLTTFQYRLFQGTAYPVLWFCSYLVSARRWLALCNTMHESLRLSLEACNQIGSAIFRGRPGGTPQTDGGMLPLMFCLPHIFAPGELCMELSKIRKRDACYKTYDL